MHRYPCRLRRQRGAAHREDSARPTSPPGSSSSSQSSDDVFFTPPATGGSSDEDVAGPRTPSPRRRPALRGRPLLPASLGQVGPSAPLTIPATGGVVRRMRWTKELNTCVMRAYYVATDGGTNLTAYRTKMLSVFQVLEPAVTITAQRLSDRVRLILRRKLLDDDVLERLRLEIQREHIDSTPANHPEIRRDSVLSPRGNPIDEDECVQVSVSNQDNERLRSALEDAIAKYHECPPASRPRLPRMPINKHNLALMGALNSLIATFLPNCTTLSLTHSILYCGAVAACLVAGLRFPNQEQTSRPPVTVPLWQYRIEKRINHARVLIAKLIAFRGGNTRPRVMRFVNQAFDGMNIRPDNYIYCVTERIDFWKQKVYAWANRIRRYRKRYDRFHINRIFQSDEKKVYRNWEKPQQLGDIHPPSTDAMSSFWRSIWSVPVGHCEDDWMRAVERACETVEPMSAVEISQSDIACAIRLAPNWKSPGPDGLHNFWLKWFRCSHGLLAAQFQDALELGELPEFMTTGVTHLLHKSGSTTDPRNYRPITCLPTIYKLLTSILKFKINSHIERNNIMAPSQNGCKARARGTKELLLIDMAICHQVRRNKKSVSMAWIDYKKAYDSVPHSWLRRVLEIYKIHGNVCALLNTCMGRWTTVLRQPGTGDATVSSNVIRINRGIFQGDSLSPLWFCLALNPLSTLLRDSRLGYRLHRGAEPISHLLYMDDLKLYAPKKSQLVDLLKITESFSKSIGMEFGVDKCAVAHVRSGNVVNSENLLLSEDITLRSLSELETYKYLGMPQALGIDDKVVKQSLRERFLARLLKVLKSLLSGGNKVRAFNGWVMPLLTYSFGILRWTQTELDALDRKVRSLLTVHRMHHPRSSVMRLYIPRRCGGRGFLNAKNLHNREVYNLREYFLHSVVGMHQDVVAVDKGFTPLSLANGNWRKPLVLSTSDRRDVWRGKELHGRFFQALTGPDVDPLASLAWLRFGNFFGETEGFVFAIMDEVIKTRNYQRHIIKDGTVDICRACHLPGESIRHIVSGCSRLANGEYLHRHNLVARIIHQQLALKYALVEAEVPYYQYQPEPVLDNGQITLYWDRSIVTDRFIPANKPDIVVIDRSTRRAIIVDVTIPHDVNLVKAEKEKMIKYIDLAHEVTSMWNMDSTIIVPIVISVNGLIAKSFDQHLEKLSLDSWVRNQMQKAVVLDTARIVRRFLTLDP